MNEIADALRSIRDSWLAVIFTSSSIFHWKREKKNIPIEFYVIYMVGRCYTLIFTRWLLRDPKIATTPTKIAIQWQILRFIIISIFFLYIQPQYIRICDTNGKNE